MRAERHPASRRHLCGLPDERAAREADVMVAHLEAAGHAMPHRIGPCQLRSGLDHVRVCQIGRAPNWGKQGVTVPLACLLAVRLRLAGLQGLF